ncbi:conserved hypothetical protein [Talaromyces stipitatus ATCC 10500]|uniref:Reverse transcriptase Ty1/copia-type domain-containing protein n=1 Tax=Talaromyces stipitatus (strain ATCC 10500 / CBS 375.48 / QM 6759 / NRRL 1006) TaxID=441959 RepID=B8MM21_TALSN|nr:uncharacterized protein TSTA_097890 [Talaromyces stipitatus ATCC 10500]EED13533.1 conserved hypothetical protein [Talaromyces stipitatus ATCC 10500]
MAPTDYTDFDPNSKDRKTIEPCVITRTKIYTDLYDDDLWFTFKDDFGDWTTDNLCKATVPVLGNYVTYCEPMVYMYQRVDTQEEINDAANVTIQNNAQFVQEDTPSPPSTNLHGMVTRMRASAGGLQDMIPHAETAPPTPTPPAPQAPLVQVATPTQTATWQGTGYVPAIRDQERMYSQVGQFAPLYVNSIAQLRKVYTTDSTKYGDNEDSFDLAHNIFLDLCRQMGLHTAEARNQAFSVMLKGLALDYYYTWKDQWERMGIDPAVAVKNHFENDEHLRKVQTDWDAINLYTVIVKYPEKSTTECLEMMFRDIQKLYHKLRPELRNEVIWHAKLISATRTHPACHAATGNPASTIPGLMQSLRGSVSQFEDTKRAAQQHFAGTYNTDPYDVPRTNMTERRFFNNNLRYQPQNRSRFTRKPSRHFRGPRNDKKTCYICKKPGHLSYNHSDEEREAHKREWNKNRSGSYQQFMAEIEGWEYDPESIEELASSGAYFEDDSTHRQPSARYRDDDFEAYINNKEITQPRADFDEVLEQTRFTDSRKQEVDGLLERGVFHFVHENEVPKGERIFNSRFVDEMKNSGTDKAFEKSRLVVQAYNDEGKDFILTESPTIQRCSQRLILCLTACMVTHSLWLRDVVQAYIHSQTYLNRDIFVRPPLELAILLSPGTLLKVVKPLYGIPESGNHWFNTYHSHHTEKLQIETSTYDPCLLHCIDPSNGFGIVGMQTDDTLILADNAFANREEKKIKAAKIQCKPRERLSPTNPLKFNSGLISETAQGIMLSQERTCKLIQIVQEQHANMTSSRGKIRKNASPKEQYVSQRALGAYIASLTQPEATFDYAFAAQSTNPQKEDIKYLNKRLQWQIDNPYRGLKFVKLNINTIKLYAFVDAAFANNKDLSSQIGFVIVLADASNNANIVHWSSVKCKRITRSVLASELYAMVNGFDFAASIKATVTQILHLENPLPLVICTDSKSLYDCLVKLGTTQEKRLMINLMCLHQSYKRQEITEVKWIDGNSNPADAMTKNKACNALQILVDTNKLHITVDGWVERSTTTPQNRAIKANSVAFANPQ